MATQIKPFLLVVFIAPVCVLGIGVLLLLHETGSTESNPNQPAIVLSPTTGSYSVGRRSYDWTDNSRSDGFHFLTKRELMVWIWYPAERPTSAKSAAYLPGEWGRKSASRHSLDMRLRVGNVRGALTRNPIPSKLIENIQIHALDDVPVVSGESKFPVLLFSPGLGNMPTDYTALIEDVASHGYVVVGVNPTDFVPVTVFSDGKSVGMLRLMIGGGLESKFRIWVKDLTFALNQLERLNGDSSSPFRGKLDLDRVGVFGHSYGGAAAIVACAEDARVKVCSDMDGTPRGNRAEWKLSKPFLLLQSEHPQRTEIGHEGFNGDDPKSLAAYHESNRAYWVVIKGTHHRGFSDEAFYPLPEKVRNELIGSLPGPRIVQITNAYICAFFDQSLNSAPSSMPLDQLSPEFPEVTWERH
jgi:hypothetical protein